VDWTLGEDDGRPRDRVLEIRIPMAHGGPEWPARRTGEPHRMRQECVDYLKTLAEGRDDGASWEMWWETHRDEMRQTLPVGHFYRLQYSGPRAAEFILDKLGIEYSPPPVSPVNPTEIPAHWLQERVTIEEVEERFREIGRYFEASWQEIVDPIPWGWPELVSHMQDGDEIWYYHSPPGRWAAKMGRAGYVLVRDGVQVGAIITVMN
jgi:hypothetical protein